MLAVLSSYSDGNVNNDAQGDANIFGDNQMKNNDEIISELQSLTTAELAALLEKTETHEMQAQITAFPKRGWAKSTTTDSNWFMNEIPRIPLPDIENGISDPRICDDKLEVKNYFSVSNSGLFQGNEINISKGDCVNVSNQTENGKKTSSKTVDPIKDKRYDIENCLLFMAI